MSLQIWLPLNGDVENKGLLGPLTHTFHSSPVINDSGKIGKCYTFDGVDDYINYPVDKTFFNGKEISYSAWVKCTWSDTGNSKAGTVMEIAADLCMTFSCTSSQVKYGFWRAFSNNGSRAGDTQSATDYVSNNKWHHVAVTFDHGINKIYIDGALNRTVDSSAKYTANWSALLGNAYVGVNVGYSQGSASTSHFPGDINDVRIYDHCLTQKEVKEISKALTIHYKLDNSGFGQPNLISDSVYESDPWKSAILETLDLDGKAAKRVSHNTLYTKTSNGTTELFPGMTYEANTQYTISVDWRDDYRTDNKISSMYLRFHHSDDSVTSINSGDLRDKHYWTHRSLTSTAGKTVTKITTTYGNGGSMYIANLKLEKGAVDTGYAPYDDIPVYDCSGYCHDGTITGNLTISSDTPRYRISTKLSDSASSIGIGNLSTYLPEKVFTFNIWFKKVTGEWSTKAWETILGGPSGFELEAKLSSTTKAYIHPYSWGGGSTSNPNGYSIEYALDVWHMLTMVRTTSNSKFYLDGELKVTGTAGSLPSGDYFLGAWQTAIKQNYRGYLSDARIYATAFTDDDILELYNTMASTDRAGNLYAREVVEE